MPSFPESQQNLPTYDEVVLLACQKQNVPWGKKQKTLSRVRGLKVAPYYITDVNGHVQAGLANIEVVKALQKTGINSSVNVPDPETSMFMRLQDATVEQPVGSSLPELDSMLALSPFSKVFRGR